MLRGGGCALALGWYNVASANAAPPAAADIHVLVPESPSYLNGIYETTNLTGFEPLGWDNRDPQNLSRLAWTPKSFSTGDLTANTAYLGGNIGLALIGDANSVCNQTKYSVYGQNVKNADGVPWVTALVYQSTVDPSAVYLAFEDGPMSTADWRMGNTSAGPVTVDGDFNDFVFYVSGLGPTAACPDPTCQSVMCDPGSTCSNGVCVSAGTAGGGGATSTGGSAGSATANGGASANSGGATSGGASANSGGATSGGASGAATSSAGAPDNGGGSPSNAGASGSDASGASSVSSVAGGNASSSSARSGCSCRVGSTLSGDRRPWLFLALGAAFLARKRRRVR